LLLEQPGRQSADPVEDAWLIIAVGLHIKLLRKCHCAGSGLTMSFCQRDGGFTAAGGLGLVSNQLAAAQLKAFTMNIDAIFALVLWKCRRRRRESPSLAGGRRVSRRASAVVIEEW